MEEKDKYDTNPLDPDFARKTEEVGGATSDVRLPHNASNEGELQWQDEAEAPTRRYLDERLPQSYPSVFNQETYQPPLARSVANTPPAYQSPTTQNRSVAGLGLPERLACVLPYTPFYIGIVIAIVELFLTPRTELRTRFHAAQGLALHLAILLISFLFSLVGIISGSHIGGLLFWVAAFAFLIVSMIRVWKGEAHRITQLGDATRWLNERIEPRK